MNEQSGTVAVFGDACRVFPLTASTTVLIKSGLAKLDGVVINSHTSGTMAVYDSLLINGTGTLVHSTISFAAGERTINLKGETFTTGLVVAVGGTASITIQYR